MDDARRTALWAMRAAAPPPCACRARGLAAQPHGVFPQRGHRATRPNATRRCGALATTSCTIRWTLASIK